MVLSYQKPSILASIFHAIFMFFPSPIPEGIFRGSKCPSILKSTILERSAISQGTKNGSKNPNNISKIDKKRSPPVEWERPEADLGAIWWRRRSKDEFSSIWGHFWIDLGRIFDKFRLILDVVFHGFDAALASINRVACK